METDNPDPLSSPLTGIRTNPNDGDGINKNLPDRIGNAEQDCLTMPSREKVKRKVLILLDLITEFLVRLPL